MRPAVTLATNRRRAPHRGGHYRGSRGPLLRHDADLLRQRRAPHRPRLHDHHRRRPGPLAPPARRRRLVPDGHRRARAQGAPSPPRPPASRRTSRPTNSARFREAWAALDIAYDDFIRTTEPRHYAATQALLQQAYDNGCDRARHLRGPVLRLLRGVLQRVGAGRRQPLPDPPPAGRDVQRGELLLQPLARSPTGSCSGSPTTPTRSRPSPSATRCSASSARASRTSP